MIDEGEEWLLPYLGSRFLLRRVVATALLLHTPCLVQQAGGSTAARAAGLVTERGLLPLDLLQRKCVNVSS
jgi:hypothetical protein